MIIKSALEIMSTNPNWSREDPDNIEGMHLYAKQFIDAAAEICDSKYPSQNKESILKLKQLIK